MANKVDLADVDLYEARVLSPHFANYLESVGVFQGRNKNYFCPWHEESNPSASLYVADKTDAYLLHCFTCDKTLGFIAFVKERHSLNYWQAVDFCCRFAGQPNPWAYKLTERKCRKGRK